MDETNQNEENNNKEIEVEENENITEANTKTHFLDAKRKRRSKNDFEGRSFKCPECGKSYLSMPALNNHRKTKHDYGKNGERKGRGRPRKEPTVISANDINPQTNYSSSVFNLNSKISYTKIEKKYNHFFEKEHRRTVPNEKIDKQFLEKLLSIIYSFYKDNFYYPNDSSQDENEMQIYPYFSYLINTWDTIKNLNFTEEAENYNENNSNNNINGNISKNRSSTLLKEENQQHIITNNIDKVLLYYMKDCVNRTNKEYYEKLVRFCVLLREGINMLHENENYTGEHDCEEIPKMLNKLIKKYFEENSFFGFDTKELIDIISHFCHWLYLNKFTTAKILY